MSDLDDLVRRVERQIAANRTVLQAVHKQQMEREYRNLTYEKQTGKPLV
ncbi:hypothetical protein ACFQGT_09915 [Natrialbaceae archaeon GCM10025810]